MNKPFRPTAEIFCELLKRGIPPFVADKLKIECHYSLESDACKVLAEQKGTNFGHYYRVPSNSLMRGDQVITGHVKDFILNMMKDFGIDGPVSDWVSTMTADFPDSDKAESEALHHLREAAKWLAWGEGKGERPC